MSDSKDITNERSKSVALHDNGVRAGSLIEQSVKSLDREQLKALGAHAAEKMIDLEIKQREQQLDYVAGKKSIEDHIDAWNMINKEGKTTGVKMKSEVNTGAGKTTIETRTGGTCFVATATYMDQNHPDVQYLRAYRDDVLIRSRAGRAFIRWYWTRGPQLASLVAKHRALRSVSKFFIGRFVLILRMIRVDRMFQR
jgi:hypothetical protein